MQHDESAYFMENSTELPARSVNVLFDVAILREIFPAVMGLWIHTGGSNNGFRPYEFVEGPGTGELELTLSESRKAGDLNLRASSPSKRGRFLEVACSNQSPRWRLVQPCLRGLGVGKWDDKRLR